MADLFAFPDGVVDLAKFTVQQVLDGVTYTLLFQFNERADAWWVRVLDESGVNVLVGDTCVVADYPLSAYITGRSPPGLMNFVDSSGQGQDPGFGDIGGRVREIYFRAAELGLA